MEPPGQELPSAAQAGHTEGLQASNWYTKRAQQRWVVPASGMRRLRRAASSAGTELTLIQDSGTRSGVPQSQHAHKRGDTGDGQTQKDRQLSPALKALSQLSHEGSDGWIADLEKLRSRGSTNQRRPSLHRNGPPNMQKTGMQQGSMDLEATWLQDLSMQQLTGQVRGVVPRLQLPQQRQLLHLRLPSCSSSLQGNAAEDRSTGMSGLVVLPSDGPSSRQEATDVLTFLQSIAASPVLAADRALAWRKDTLNRLCGRAMEPAMQSGPPGQTSVMVPDLHVFPAAVIGGEGHGKSVGSLDSKADSAAGIAWDLQCAAGVLLGVGVAMADLIRQAEGACAERGATMAAAWNLHVAVVDSMVGRLEDELTRQERENIALQARLMHLQSVAEDNRRLQQEVDRLNQEARSHEVAAARAAMKEVEAEERLRSGLAELDAIERMARRQLAAARWRQALILQCSGHKQSLFRLPSARRASHQPVLQQVEMLAGTATAVAVSSFRRDRELAEQRRARASGDLLDPGARFATVVQETMTGSTSLVGAMAGDVKKAAQMLDTLAPEAQAMVVSLLAPAERTELLRGMSDEGAAACLASMSLPARTAVLADLAAADSTLATCALAFIWHSPVLAGKWLGSMAAREGARDLLDNTDLQQQRLVLLRLKPHQAAGLLEEMEAHSREGILQGLAPEATARILQAMPRAMAVTSLQVLIKPIAQQVLTCYGHSEKAALLSHLTVSDTLRLIQGWASEKQREFLQTMPGSIASEVTVQLLLQTSHQWTYTPPAPIAGTASDDEEEGQGVEVDEDEVRELEEAAGRELHAAAAAVSGLPFEDKVKLVGALSPAAAAALMGVLSKQEGAQLLSELPQPQLIAIVEAMAPPQRAEAEESLLALAKPGTPRRRSLRSILRPERPDTASTVGSRASRIGGLDGNAPGGQARSGSRLSIHGGASFTGLETVSATGMRRPARDARSSRKSIIRPPTAGSAEEADVGAQLRPSKVGFKEKSAMRQVSTKEEPDQDALQRPANLGRSSRKSMHMAVPAASNAEQEAEGATAGDLEERLSVPAGGFGQRISVGTDSDARRSQRVSAKARLSIKPPKTP
ncbi:g6974 [Coccomyxa elongata]